MNAYQAERASEWHDTKDGYVIRNVAGVHIYQHREVMEKKLGRKLECWEDVHHKDGNRQNNDEQNLEVLTHSEHSRVHMLGEQHPTTKLTDVQVIELLTDRAHGMSVINLAIKYGVCTSNVYKILQGKYRKGALVKYHQNMATL